MEVKPGYKMTEVGVIPEDWDVEQVVHIATKVASGTSKVDSEFGDYPVYGSTGIIGRARSSSYSGKAILIARVGANAGKLQIVDGCYGVTDNTIILKVDLCFNFDYIWRQLEVKNLNTMVFGSGQPLVTGTQIKDISFPLPPTKAEQEAIASALSDVDALIESLEQLLAKKRSIKQGAMQELLTGKRRLPGFSGEWVVRKLGDIAPLQRGFDLPSSRLQSGKYPVVYSNGILNHHSKFMVKAPGVVTGRSGTLGRVQFLDTDFWPHNTSLWVCNFNSNYPLFIYYLFIFIGLDKFLSGSGVPTLNRNDVHAYLVLFPCEIKEQVAISCILKEMDTELKELDAKLIKYRHLKQAMMQELLTGRIRLV